MFDLTSKPLAHLQLHSANFWMFPQSKATSQKTKPVRCINSGAAASAIRECVHVKQQAPLNAQIAFILFAVSHTHEEVSACLLPGLDSAWFCFYKGLETNSHFISLKK